MGTESLIIGVLGSGSLRKEEKFCVCVRHGIERCDFKLRLIFLYWFFRHIVHSLQVESHTYVV